MNNVFHRHCHSQLPTADYGDGVYIYDTDGKPYLDACGGAAVSCLGHNHPVVKTAITTQLEKIAYAHSGFFTTQVAEELATQLAAIAPEDLNHTYFTCGGSEAVETGLKLARQYYVERGENKRHKFISRRQSYHGNTLGALAVGGNQWRREPYSPLLIQNYTIAPCYSYRDRPDSESPFEYGQRMANELETMILSEGADTIIGFIAEPVVGATMGATPAVEGYFQRIRRICDQYGILLILDEVMCGMGRTGTWFAQEQDNVQADIVTIAKGLGAGYQPIGATICSDSIYNTIRDGSGFFQHGHTYMAHATAMAGSLAVINILHNENLVATVHERGQQLHKKLQSRFNQHPNVGDIRGRGLFLALELVADKHSKKPLAPESKVHDKIKAAAMNLGLMIYPMAGTIDGQSGHHILLAPPFIISENQLDELVDKLEQAITTVL